MCGHLLQARGFFWRSSQSTPSADSGEEEDQDRFADRGAAYPLRLRLAPRGRVDEDRALGRVHHLCGDAPEPNSSDSPELPAAHNQ